MMTFTWLTRRPAEWDMWDVTSIACLMCLWCIAFGQPWVCCPIVLLVLVLGEL
jgi:hypothetical protein